MPSPFPGMDPWLESPAIFPDLHSRFISQLSEALNASLPAPYFTSISTRVWVEDSNRHVEPDVDVLKPPQVNGAQKHAGGSGSVATLTATLEAKPIIVRVDQEEMKEWFLEIHASPGGERLVTTVELLSPSNKSRRSKGRKKYLKKQREMLKRKVNLVEIDLLRRGLHSTAVSLNRAVAETGPYDYHACVHRYHEPNEYEVYPIVMAQPLPAIAIPLLPPVADVVVSLQDVLTSCYDRGLYARRAHYDQPCDPPLSADHAAWAKQILQAQKLIPAN